MTVIRKLKTDPTDSSFLPVFTPAVGAGGMIHRWKASDIVAADGAPVASWPASSGTIAMNQATSTKQPIMRTESGVRMVRFDGVDDTLKMASAPIESNVKTVVMLARVYGSPTVSHGLMGLGGASMQNNPQLTPKQVRIFWSGTGANKSIISNVDIVTPSFHTISAVGDRIGNTYALTVDATDATNITAGTAPFQGNGQLEPGTYASTQWGAIDVIEILTYNSALTSAQRQAVRTALQGLYPTIVA